MFVVRQSDWEVAAAILYHYVTLSVSFEGYYHNVEGTWSLLLMEDYTLENC